MRDTERPRVRERRRRRRGKAVVPDDDGIVALPIYCPRGQATSCFGPQRTVTWTEQGVQKDNELVQ